MMVQVKDGRWKEGRDGWGAGQGCHRVWKYGIPTGNDPTRGGGGNGGVRGYAKRSWGMKKGGPKGTTTLGDEEAFLAAE
ncbi:hypothetical protein SUGI_0545430 [Cryptomeria japonica]|nr:hypothetical protein SUGI_0545430 [Cryptomeria japonica]